MLIQKHSVFGQTVYDVREAKDLTLAGIAFQLRDIVLFGNSEAYKVIETPRGEVHGAMLARMTPVETEKMKAEFDLSIILADCNITVGGLKEELR